MFGLAFSTLISINKWYFQIFPLKQEICLSPYVAKWLVIKLWFIMFLDWVNPLYEGTSYSQPINPQFQSNLPFSHNFPDLCTFLFLCNDLIIATVYCCALKLVSEFSSFIVYIVSAFTLFPHSERFRTGKQFESRNVCLESPLDIIFFF